MQSNYNQTIFFPSAESIIFLSNFSMSCSTTSIIEMYLMKKTFSITFSSNTCSYLSLLLSLASIQTSLTDTITLLKVLVTTIQANREKNITTTKQKKKLAGLNWELNTFYYLEQKIKVLMFMLNCFIVPWIISCSQEFHFPKPVQTQYMMKAQQKLKQKHYHCSKSLQALPFP